MCTVIATALRDFKDAAMDGSHMKPFQRVYHAGDAAETLSEEYAFLFLFFLITLQRVNRAGNAVITLVRNITFFFIRHQEHFIEQFPPTR